MEERKKANSGQTIYLLLNIAMVMLAGLVHGFFLSDISDDGFLSRFHLIILFIVLFFLIYLQIILHELGHLVFGLATGYRFVSFRVGSMMFIKQNGAIRRKHYSLMGTGGQCLLEPPGDINDKIPFVLYNLGGVLFNLGTAVIAFLIFPFIRNSVWLAEIMVITAITGLFFALMNGIPLCVGTIDNDARNIISARKNPGTLRCLWIQLKMNAFMSEGVRLKDMPEEWFEFPEEQEMQNALGASIAVFACGRTIDQMDIPKAAQLIKELLDSESGIALIHRYMLISDFIYCETVGENRADVKEEYRSKEYIKYSKAAKSSLSLLRTQYACELLENKDEAAAAKKLKLFEKSTKNYPYYGALENERELMAYALEKTKSFT